MIMDDVIVKKRHIVANIFVIIAKTVLDFRRHGNNIVILVKNIYPSHITFHMSDKTQ